MAHPSSTELATSPRQQGFVFATCFPASNAWLRRDVARMHPELRLAFSAPSLVTWKAAGNATSLALRSPLALIDGVGVGRAKDEAELVHLTQSTALALRPRGALALHVYDSPVDQDAPVVLGADSTPDVATLRSSLSQVLGIVSLEPCKPGDLIVDVVRLRETPGSYFVGWHQQRDDRPSRIGGVVARPVPLEAPSRAYAKTWELLALAEMGVEHSDAVVELGAAPGGGTWAWLEQGAHVTAIDPADMAEALEGVAQRTGGRYRHWRVSAALVTAKQLPRRPRYLYSDMNLAPAVVLRYLERIVSLAGPPTGAILVNVKVNDQKVEAQLAGTLARFAALGERIGLPLMRAVQLPSHRKEIGVILRRRQNSVAPNRSTAKR